MRKNTSRSAISQGMRGSMQPVVFTCEIRNIRREDLLDTYFQINLVISGSGEDIGTWMNCHYKLAISPRYPLLWLNDVMVGLLVKASTSAISYFNKSPNYQCSSKTTLLRPIILYRRR